MSIEKLNEFRKLQQQKAAQQIPIQTEWVKVDSVDWEEKTMVAIGETNGLDYEDILLGLGNSYKKPVVGCLALIGMIDNSAACFMIDCEKVEAIEITDKSGFKWVLNSGQLTINGENYSGLVKAPELKEQLDKMTARIDGIIEAINNGVPGSSDGGATLHTTIKAGLSAIVETEDFSEIENETIKHGDGE